SAGRAPAASRVAGFPMGVAWTWLEPPAPVCHVVVALASRPPAMLDGRRASVRRKPVVLVTGAGGEVGLGLIRELAAQGVHDVLGFDARAIPDEVARRCLVAQIGDILDRHLLERLRSEFEIPIIFHLAALLSTRAEFVPETAHEVNVQGTLNLLHVAVEEARSLGHPVKFLFPSSIAAYGFPDLAAKRAAGRVAEDSGLQPITMYGCNKLYCEHLGRYFARHYRQLAAGEPSG